MCRKDNFYLLLLFLIFSSPLWGEGRGEGIFLKTTAFAEEKQWSGAGGSTTWEDASNWFPAALPALTDDVVINLEDAEVAASEKFFARTLSIGGREASAFTANDFVDAVIAPESNTDNALHIRKDGLVVLKGAGSIVVKGSFKNSEEALPSEPAFMFGIE